MSGAYILKPRIWCPPISNFFFFLFFFLMITTRVILSETDKNNNGGEIGALVEASNPTLPPPSPSVSQDSNKNYTPLKPGVIVVVAILTTVFSITFLMLLYAKHCKRGGSGVSGGSLNDTAAAARKNSGIERSVINSLPAFRFGSLRGRKDGLECAVCLNRFEPAEVLRLLPKCKHAFHVECVDTWLDAHSTCPLCRYRVHPEDVLLIVDDPTPGNDIENGVATPESTNPAELPEPGVDPDMVRRVSGRHSSAGEETSGFDLEIVLHRPRDGGGSSRETAPFTRRSLDSFKFLRRNNNTNGNNTHNHNGCFERPWRKDGMLLTRDRTAAAAAAANVSESDEQRRRRLEHRVIVSGAGGPHRERWSDPQPSDLLYLGSEMIISDGGRRRSSSASGSRPPSFSSSRHCRGRQQQQLLNLPLRLVRRDGGGGGDGGPAVGSDGNGWNGGSVISSRCVSEITGLRRCSNSYAGSDDHSRPQRHAGVVSRWRAWISQTRPAVRSERAPFAA